VDVDPLSFLASFRLVDVVLRVKTDDPEFLSEFSSVFGQAQSGSGQAARTAFDAAITVRRGPDSQHGLLRVSGDELADPAEFLLAFSSPTVPIRRLEVAGLAGTALGIGDDPTPALRFHAGDCVFRLSGRWRRILSHYLFLRLLRLRDDALFFHAASLGIRDTGVLLIGPKGSGKSTLALALAARGHNFLGDETACYQPASGQLLPFRRPVSIKPGRAAAAVVDALARGQYPSDEDGVRRVEVESLLPVPEAVPVDLGAVVFLRGFSRAPEFSRLEASREELSALQPLASSLANRPATLRVFEMVRMLSRVRTYGVVAGDPDDTAVLIEEGLGACP
jgi:energy-coupling factor transporter ATP-binding protein EcfA2